MNLITPLKAPKVKVSAAAIDTQKSDIIIVGIYQDDLKGKSPKYNSLIKSLNPIFKETVLDTIALDEFEGKLASTLVVNTGGELSAKRIILLGLGEKKTLKDLQQLRKAIAKAARQATSLKADSIAIELPSGSKLNDADIARAIVEVSSLAPYKYTRFKTEKKEKYKGIKEITLVDSSASEDVKDAAAKGEIAANGVLMARELVIGPPNEVNPTYMANLAKKIAKDGAKSGLTVKVLDEKQCAKLGMGAYLAVGRGSANPPKFIHFHYKPKSKKKELLRHIAFVGKGVTFDTGGLSLKPSKSMVGMKYDMAGSAAVFGLMSVIADLKPNVEVTAIVAATENMPDGDSYRPEDILTAMSGMTIEVLNTDAEGRLTLADAVYYAAQQGVDEIIDIATLTGAVVVALGETEAGVMTNNQKTLDGFMKAAATSGERLWQLPLNEEHDQSIREGTIADIVNTGSKGQAGSQNGGVFVKQFVDGKPWIHMDIAGACWPERWDTPFTPRNNPAGFGVLSFIRYIEQESK